MAQRAFDGHLATVQALSDEYDPAEVAAAALQMLWTSQHSGPTEAAEELNADSEQPEVGMMAPLHRHGASGRPAPRRSGRRDQQRSRFKRGKAIGVIDILDRTAFVEVPAPDAVRVVAALRQATLRGRKVKVEMSQAPPGPQGRSAPGRKPPRSR